MNLYSFNEYSILLRLLVREASRKIQQGARLRAILRFDPSSPPSNGRAPKTYCCLPLGI